MTTKILNMINESNKKVFESFMELDPIKFDGLHCPKCNQDTVYWIGRIWCPSTNCDFGEPPQINIITKWV
jgi:hypothetical protein